VAHHLDPSSRNAAGVAVVELRGHRLRQQVVEGSCLKVIAAFLVALTEALTAQYLGNAWVLITLFGLIAVVLIIRPRGVAGVLETTRA
jgi:hypothetical protein